MSTFAKLLLILTALFLPHTSPAQDGSGVKNLPLKVSFRKSQVNDSLVARFTNTSTDKFLTAILTFKNSTYNEVKRRKLSVGPGHTAEVGWAQGWKFMSGEAITIESVGYAPLAVTVP